VVPQALKLVTHAHEERVRELFESAAKVATEFVERFRPSPGLLCLCGAGVSGAVLMFARSQKMAAERAGEEGAAISEAAAEGAAESDDE